MTAFAALKIMLQIAAFIVGMTLFAAWHKRTGGTPALWVCILPLVAPALLAVGFLLSF